jgi:YebC/PmpR family DNA-binding regulatory protein
LFEGYAPHGIAVIVETATDNNNRTVANVRAIFNKCDGNFGTSGSVIFMFDHVCNFTVKKEDITIDLEELELELIDFDVEEVFIDDEGVIIYAPFEQFGAIQSFFEKNNVEILSSGFERMPTTTSKLPEEQQADVEKLLEKLEEDDDVQQVYHSMQM